MGELSTDANVEDQLADALFRHVRHSLLPRLAELVRDIHQAMDEDQREIAFTELGLLVSQEYVLTRFMDRIRAVDPDYLDVACRALDKAVSLSMKYAPKKKKVGAYGASKEEGSEEADKAPLDGGDSGHHQDR